MYVFSYLPGADIKNVCNEAAINAARRKAKFVTDRDLEVAVERVVAGEQIKKNNVKTIQTLSLLPYTYISVLYIKVWDVLNQLYYEQIYLQQFY